MTNIKNHLEILIATIGTALAIALYRYFDSNKILESLNAILVAAILSSILIVVLRFIFFELPMWFKSTRKLIDKRAHLEGIYYEIFDDRNENKVSIGCIKYMRKNKDYQYFGNNFSKDNFENPQDTWQSTKVYIDIDTSTLKYFFTTNYRSLSIKKLVSGFGILELQHETGYYYDLSDHQLKRHDHRIRKLTSDDFFKYLGVKSEPAPSKWHKIASEINKELE